MELRRLYFELWAYCWYTVSTLECFCPLAGVIVLMLILAKRRQAKIRNKNKLQREKRQQPGSSQENVLYGKLNISVVYFSFFVCQRELNTGVKRLSEWV